MLLGSTPQFRNPICHRANRLLPGLVLALLAFLVGARPACALNPKLMSAAHPALGRTEFRLILACVGAAQDSTQDTAPAIDPLQHQNLVQVPLQTATQEAIQKAMQDAKAHPAATQAMPGAGGNAAQNSPPNSAQDTSANTAQTGSADANPSSSGAADASSAPSPGQSSSAPTGSIPPRIMDGITTMLSARASLEKAGSKWGGHKQTAIKLIDQALAALGQTQPPDNGEVKSTPADESPAMQAALTQLTAAQTDFQNAKNPWAGRRDQALALVKQALSEVQAGIDYSKSHNTY
jgi:hypothetical protein